VAEELPDPDPTTFFSVPTTAPLDFYCVPFVHIDANNYGKRVFLFMSVSFDVKFTFVSSCIVYTSILLPVADLLPKYAAQYLLEI